MVGIYLSIVLQPFVGPWQVSQFLNLYIIIGTPWTGDQLVARPLPTHKHIINAQKSRVGFEPTIPAF
jgi:hypothetical protein